MADKRRVEWLGGVLIWLSVATGLAYPLVHSRLVALLEQYVSPDHSITPGGEDQLIIAAYLSLALTALAGLFLVGSQREPWRSALPRAFFSDPLLPGRRFSPLCMLTTSSLVGISVAATYYYYYLNDFAAFKILYFEGAPEWLTEIATFASILGLCEAVRCLGRAPMPVHWRSGLRVAYLLLIVLLLGDAMEELSWGQQIFHWQTPADLFRGNIQHETNLHNYLNDYFAVIYASLALIPIPVVLTVWFEGKQLWPAFTRYVLPHPSMIGISLIIAAVAVRRDVDQELLEELVAVLVFFYCLRLFRHFRALPRRESISRAVPVAAQSRR